MPISLFQEAGWIGLGLLSLVFAANAVGLMDPRIAAHAFWKAPKDNKDLQLAGFLKNTAIVGGLVIAAAWRSPS